jgi:hypothetical protein
MTNDGVVLVVVLKYYRMSSLSSDSLSMNFWVFYVLLKPLIQRRGRKHERMKQFLVTATHTDL